jgi:hypothetical protein
MCTSQRDSSCRRPCSFFSLKYSYAFSNFHHANSSCFSLWHIEKKQGSILQVMGRSQLEGSMVQLKVRPIHQWT